MCDRVTRRPPESVFYNRMSASPHTRDHRFSDELTAGVLAFLVRWGGNGAAALDLAISKLRQYAALERRASARLASSWLPAATTHLAISRLSSRPIAVARDMESSSFIPSRPAGACGERLVCRAGQRHPIAPGLWSRVSSGDPPLAQTPRDAGISQLGPNPCRRALAGLPHPPGRISSHAPSRAGYA